MGSRRRTTGSFEVRRTTGSNEVVDRLFVYATLRQGQTAHSLIANQIARSAKASTTGAMYAFPMGYAGLIEAAEPSRVVGELLWLTELPATFGLLDAYEGEEFARIIKQVTLESGEVVWSWIYVLSDPEAVKHGTLLEHGDWARYMLERSRG
ncbi:MAG TPA: gamma-glutamylcyclotransferase family protein [Kofleriaceae bacterium]|nr:gamma-glutamylcyclotransferase family protein [Kofleriaceae bacterium]